MLPYVHILFAVLVSWQLGVLPGWAQDEVQVDASALSYEQGGDVVSARGDVVVTKGDARLTADTVSVNRPQNELTAEGNVVLTDPQGEVRADRLRLELLDETGEIENGTIRLPRDQYMITGRTLQKLYGQSYHVEDAGVTTCECDRIEQADWSIGADSLDVTLGGRGVVRHGVFRVRDIPLLYVPYGSIPVRQERHSGFLTPGYGFSSKRGFQWEQPLYWAISKSQDLTLTTDIETSARAGLLGEYRYAPNEHLEGELSISYFNEQFRGPASTTSPLNRWSVAGTHRQRTVYDIELYSDLFFVSDDTFLREVNVAFHPGFDDRNLRARRFTDSRVGGVKTWQHAQLRAEALYYQDLRDDQRKRQGLRQQDAFEFVPRVQLHGQRRAWNDRIDVGLNFEGGHFFRSRGYHGQRFDLAPWISLPFSLGGYVYGSLKATGRETLYRMSSRSPGKPRRLGRTQLDGFRTREMVQVEAELGTRVSRVFDLGWGRLRKLQHIVEPHVAFTYVPRVGQDDLPLYDDFDRINRRSLFVYGVSNRLMGKFSAPRGDAGGGSKIRELARLTVTQAYDPSRRLREPREQRFGVSETGQHFTDMDIRFRLQPVSFFRIASRTTYDIDQGDIVATRIGGTLRDPRPLPETSPMLRALQRRTRIGLAYRTITDRLLKEVNANVVLRLHDLLTVAYFTRYDVNDNSFIGSNYYFRVFSPQKCWAFDFGIVDKVNPSETEFRFSVSLLGLASAGRSTF